MLLSNEAELLAMEAEKYSGVNPIVVDNNNLTIGLDSGFMEAVSSISGAISGLDNKLDISAFTGYSAALDSGLSNAFETVHNDITELQGDDSYLSGSIDYLSGVVTTGLSAYSAGPNINITDYVISGKDWLDTIQEASAYAAQQNPTSSTEWNSTYETVQSNSASWASETFTGVDTDSTLTGNGKDTPLGVAEVQTLSSDETISITSANNEVILGVNSSWFNEAVNSAVTGAQGDVEVNTYVHNNSATIDVVNTTVQSDSGKWNDTYTNYSNNSASYLTDASQFYPMNSNPSGYLTEETDWTNTIKEASANAFDEATALIPPAFDPTFMSGAIDNKLDATAFSTVSGDFATTGDLENYATTSWVSNINTAIRNDMGTIAANTANNYSAITSTSSFLSGAVDNKLDTTAFGDVSGTFLTAHQSLDGYATTAWVDSQGYLTAHQPISADEWNNVYDTVNVYSGAWTGSESSPTAVVDSHGSIDIVSSNNTVYFDVKGTWFNDAVNSAYTGSQGDANVNAYVHNNSATINDVNTTVQSNSSVWDSVTGKEDLISYGYSAGAISSINGSAILGETIPYEVYGISAGENITIWEDNNTLWISAQAGQGGDVEVNDLVHSNSAIWDDVTNKLDTTAYVPFDPTYMSGAIDDKLDITAFNIPTSSNWNEVYNTVNSNSGLWSAGDTEVNNVVHNNSATWDSVTNKLDTTAFNDISGSFLTAHQSLEGYATENWVTSQGYITGVDLTPYLTTATYATDSGTFATTTMLNDYQTTADMTSYYTKTDTSSKQELSDAIGNVETLLSSL